MGGLGQVLIKPIATTASRTRVNLMGSLNLETMEVIAGEYKTIDSAAMEEHFKELLQKSTLS